MQKLATRHYPPIAIKDFTMANGDFPWLMIHDQEDDKNYRRNRIKFHIKADDYFATLATIINCINYDMELAKKNEGKILKNLESDLLYLHENYKIIKKDEVKKVSHRL
ncbi:MAG: hypothetical protein ABIE43_03900 [Patescibacteria group bacterium]